MNLKDYFANKPYGSKVELANRLGITKTWMSQLIAGREKCSPAMAVKIEHMTEGVVARADMRPDLFGG
jgi:DNA-binding transcriptional regulator YdaS (Cro superfamily)